MSTLNDARDWLEAHLPGLLAEHRVPGAAVAVYADGDVIDVGAGVLNTGTGVTATADSLFQIGSITKVWTATLVLQLVDEGTLDLDAPVRRYLPDFALADSDAAGAITIRQLLNHTSGFEGDIFTDTGDGEDCVEKYVATLSGVGQLFPPGERFSYNNAGYCVLGRIVEVLRGKGYDRCLREHLFAPLGLTHAATGAGEAILHRAAVGHLQPEPDADPQPAPVWSLVRSNNPAGASLAMRPRDLIAFARMHLNGGRADDGTVVLTGPSAAAMREHQVELPNLRVLGDAWGLGWELFDRAGTPMYGHDGSTIGQYAFLRILPEHNVAVAVCTNGGNAFAVYRAVTGHLLAALAGVELPAFPVPPADRAPLDAGRYVGLYSCEVADLTVEQDPDGRVWLETAPKGDIAEMVGQSERVELVRLEGDTLIQLKPDRGVHMPVAFVGDDGTGHALYLHTGRAVRRAPASA